MKRFIWLLFLVSLWVPSARAETPIWELYLPTYEKQNLDKNRRWIAARRAHGENPKARVGVFADAGVWNLGVVSLVKCLESEGIPCRVLFGSELQKLEGLQFLILPGGLAPYQYSALGQEGANKIRGFVEGGGRCLGICAGSYLLSRSVRYQGQTYPYPLGLFDGVAEGPVAGLADYPSAGPVTLEVTSAGSSRGLNRVKGRRCLYGGGPRFVGGSKVTVLLKYPDGTAAAVRRGVGKGEMIAVGVHMERPVPEDGGEEAPPPADAGQIVRALLGL